MCQRKTLLHFRKGFGGGIRRGFPNPFPAAFVKRFLSVVKRFKPTQIAHSGWFKKTG